MGSKGRVPPPLMRHRLPGPGIVHPDAFGPGICPPPGPFPPLDMLPPPEVMEQKLAMQHVEMQRLAAENQRLAATHGTLRQELAAAQHDLQMLQAQIGAIKSDREQQKRGLLDMISKMESDLKAGDSVRLELQQSRKEVDKLVAERKELMSKIHQLTNDLHMAHTDVQQIPAMISELDALRHEYQQCRATYDYEKKLFSNHLESLQVMEKNYVAMAGEVEKLRAKLSKSANVDTRTVAGGPYGGVQVNNANEAPVQSAYSIPHGQGHAAIASGIGGVSTVGSLAAPAHASVPSVSAASAPNVPGYQAPYDPYRGTGYDQRGYSYQAQRAPAYDVLRGPGVMDPQTVPAYDPSNATGYSNQVAPEYYDLQRVAHNDASRGSVYNQAAVGASGQHAQFPLPNNSQYGSAAQTGSSYQPPGGRR